MTKRLIQNQLEIWRKIAQNNGYDIEYKIIEKDGKRYSKVHVQTFSIKDPQERAKIRSKTFWGIADAMASQWGNYNIE